jgi:hypothetical protein
MINILFLITDTVVLSSQIASRGANVLLYEDYFLITSITECRTMEVMNDQLESV